MGLRHSLPPGQLTSPRLVQRPSRDGVNGAEHAVATARQNMHYIREPGTRRNSACRSRSPGAGQKAGQGTQMPQPALMPTGN